MPRQNYSWEEKPPKGRGRRLWRWLLLVPLLVVLVGGVVAALLVMSVRNEFTELAGQYDL